jgi:hypothetical protein
VGGSTSDPEQVGDHDRWQVGQGLHHGGVAGNADGKTVLAHGVGQPGGIARAAGPSTGQQVAVRVGQHMLWRGGDLLFDELSQRRRQDHRPAADRQVGVVRVAMQVAGGELDDPGQRKSVEPGQRPGDAPVARQDPVVAALLF